MKLFFVIMMPDWWDWNTYYICSAVGLVLAIVGGVVLGLYLANKQK
jgi:hypothetical protein